MLEKIWYIDEETGFPFAGFAVRTSDDKRANLAVLDDKEGAMRFEYGVPFDSEGAPGTYHHDGPGSVVYRDNPEASGRVYVDRSGEVPRFYFDKQMEFVESEQPPAIIAETGTGGFSGVSPYKDTAFIQGCTVPGGQPPAIIAETGNPEPGNLAETSETTTEAGDQSVTTTSEQAELGQSEPSSKNDPED